MRGRVGSLVAVSLAAVLLVSCGGADLDDPSVKAEPARPAPAADPATTPPAPTTPVTAPPAATPTGPSIRVTDGQTVVAMDPETGGRRAAWDDAAISLEGNWTVARDGAARASWFDAYGVLDRTGDVPPGLHPAITSADGRWAVFAEPAPPVRPGEIGPGRTTSHFVVTDGAGTSQDLTLPGNFAPEAFGWFDETTGQARPMSLQLIEYLPPEHPTRYRVRTLDLTTEALGLPVSLRDKATLVDESMAGVSRTQVYAASSSLLFTLYQPAELASADPDYDVWEYGFVHTLATPWAGVWCVDLPEDLGMTGNSGALALSPDEQTLYVVTGAGKLGVIKTNDVNGLRVSRTADLGLTVDETDQPVVAAGTDHVWVGLGHQLLMVDPISLEVQGRAELAAPVTALTLDPASGELLAADDGQLRRWTVDGAGAITRVGVLPLPAGLGPVARIAT
jgi:hypothetical protein